MPQFLHVFPLTPRDLQGLTSLIRVLTSKKEFPPFAPGMGKALKSACCFLIILLPPLTALTVSHRHPQSFCALISQPFRGGLHPQRELTQLWRQPHIASISEPKYSGPGLPCCFPACSPTGSMYWPAVSVPLSPDKCFVQVLCSVTYTMQCLDDCT